MSQCVGSDMQLEKKLSDERTRRAKLEQDLDKAKARKYVGMLTVFRSGSRIQAIHQSLK